MRLTCFYLCILLQTAASQRVRTVKESPPANPNIPKNEITDPGWKCVVNLNAVGVWRSIQWKKFAHTTMAQFQCTWKIESPAGSKVALSLLKLNVKTGNQNAHCGRDFLQIIDKGQNRGRFCKQMQATDYISFGNKVRVDVQGEYQLPHLLRAQKDPFVLNYRAVTSAISGPIPVSSSKFKSRAWNEMRKEVVLTEYNSNNNKKEDKDNSEAWNIGKFVIIIVVCLIFLFLAIFLFRRYYCLGTKKEEKEEESFDDFHQKEELPVKAHELPVGSLHIQDESVRGTTKESRKQKKIAPEASSSSKEIPEVATSGRKKEKKRKSVKGRRKKRSPEEEEQRRKEKMRRVRRRQRKKEKERRQSERSERSERSDAERLPSRGRKSKIAPAEEKPKEQRKRKRKPTKEDSSKRKHRSDSKRKSSSAPDKSDRKSSTTKRKPKNSASGKVAPSAEKKAKKKRSERAEVSSP